MKTALTKTTILASLLVVASAWMISCSGDAGDKGDKGDAGAPCTAKNVADGVEITCGSDKYNLTNGRDGADGSGGCTSTVGTGGTWLNCDGMSPILIPNQGSGSIGDCHTETQTDLGTQVISIVCGSSEAQVGICGRVGWTGSTPTRDPDLDKPFVFYNPTVEECVNGVVQEALEVCDNATGTEAQKTYNKGTHFCQGTSNTQTTDAPRTGSKIMPRCGVSYDGGYYGVAEFCWAEGTSISRKASKCGGSEYGIDKFCVAATGKTYDRCGYTKVSDLSSEAQDASFGTFMDYDEGYIVSRTFNPNLEFCQTKTVVTDSRPQPWCVDINADPTGNTKREYGMNSADEMCVGGKVNARCGTLSGYFNAVNFFCDAPNNKTYARCDTTANLGVFVPQTHFCYSPDYIQPKNHDYANQHKDATEPNGGVVTPVCDKKFLSAAVSTFPDEVAIEGGTVNPAFKTGADAGKRDAVDSLLNVGYSTEQFCSKLSTMDPNAANKDITYVFRKCSGKWAYYPDVQACEESENADSVVVESCGNGKINVNTQVCPSNQALNTCGGVGGNVFGLNIANRVYSLDASGASQNGTGTSVFIKDLDVDATTSTLVPAASATDTQACIDGKIVDCDEIDAIPTEYFDGCKCAPGDTFSSGSCS